MKRESVATFFDNLVKNVNLVNKYDFVLLIDNKFIIDNKPFTRTNVNNIMDIARNWDGKIGKNGKDSKKSRIDTFSLVLTNNTNSKVSRKNWYENTLTFYNKKLQIYARIDVVTSNISTEHKTFETKIESRDVNGVIDKLINMKKFIIDTNKSIDDKFLEFTNS